MRYDAKHKDQSKARILAAAARQFRGQGSEAVKVTDVMQAVGMTHGGFYRHFDDKDQLLREAIATALDQICEKITKLTEGMPRVAALKTVIELYLSEDHLRHPDAGCAVAALGTEMARMPRAMKLEISQALDAYAERLGHLMPGDTDAQRRAAFLVLFPSMAGCIMTARSYADKQRQRRVLAGGRAFFINAFCSQPNSSVLEVLQ
jgi:TetR/AcrR family transcriptional repressor of nem operon